MITTQSDAGNGVKPKSVQRVKIWRKKISSQVAGIFSEPGLLIKKTEAKGPNFSRMKE